MVTVTDSQSFVDLSIIIKMMPEEMRKKINIKFIEYLENNKDQNYTSNIKSDIPIDCQEISPNTKKFLALIYRDYICDENERKQLIYEEKEGLLKIKEQEKKYEINFDKKSDNKDLNYLNELIVAEKESYILKIIQRIKDFFSKK